jgi:hypothetical protein
MINAVSRYVQKTKRLQDLVLAYSMEEWLRFLNNQHNVHERCLQTMWHGNVTTTRILLETKGKAWNDYAVYKAQFNGNEYKQKDKCSTI